MRALRHALTGLTLAFAAAPSDAGPEPDAALRARVLRLVEMMASGDEASRASAVDEFVQLGRPAVPLVSRHAYLLEDGTARDAVASALERIGIDDSIALLVGHASYWSTNGRDQMRDLVATLRSRRDPKLAVQVDLVPLTATNAARVPPDAELVIGDKLPEALAWGEFAARRVKNGIRVDVDSQAVRFEDVEIAKPRCLRVGPHKRPILVYWRHDRWYAASGALLAGRLRGEDVELWDADLDGTFAGPKDFVRLGDGAFQRIPENGLVAGPQGLAMMTIRTTSGGASATFVPEPTPPEFSDWAIRTLGVVNEFRRSVGLPPVLFNLPRSASCTKHADYWRLNGYSGHEELPSRPGYTSDGALAGRRSSVTDEADPTPLARVITATVLHRATCLGATAEGLGVGSVGGSCIWGGDLDSRDRGFPVLVPGPGQNAVPVACESEQPPPDRDNAFYARPRGYPVAVVWRGAWDDVKHARIDLYSIATPGAAPEAVAGDLFEPDHPYDAKGRAIETGAATFVASQPLDPRRTYVARFKCDRDSGPAEFTWSFSTR